MLDKSDMAIGHVWSGTFYLYLFFIFCCDCESEIWIFLKVFVKKPLKATKKLDFLGILGFCKKNLKPRFLQPLLTALYGLPCNINYMKTEIFLDNGSNFWHQLALTEHV